MKKEMPFFGTNSLKSDRQAQEMLSEREQRRIVLDVYTARKMIKYHGQAVQILDDKRGV